MSRARRRRSRLRHGWTATDRVRLVTGGHYIGSSVLDTRDRNRPADAPHRFRREAWTADELSSMELAWKYFGDELTAEAIENSPGTRPAGWWWFESSKPFDDRVEEPEQLFQMGAMTKDEIKRLRRADEEIEKRESLTVSLQRGSLFRRRWSWWHCLAHEQRDPRSTETKQLIATGRLTKLEMAIVNNPRQAFEEHWSQDQPRYVFSHLGEEERTLLGLDWDRDKWL